MKKIIMAIAILASSPVAAQTVCFPGDHACQHQQWHNQQHQNFNESFFGNKAGIPQGGPSVFDIIIGIGKAARAQEEHEMRMKLMQQELEHRQQRQRQTSQPEAPTFPLGMGGKALAQYLAQCQQSMDSAFLTKCRETFPYEKF